MWRAAAAGSDRPVRILTGSPTTLDPAAQGDAGSAAITRPAVRVADQLRRRPPGPARARRIVAVQRRWTAGHVPPAPGPDVLGRQPAAPVGRGPQLVAPDRSSSAVATRLARPGHRRRRRISARNGDRPRDRRPPRRRRDWRPGGRPRPAGDRFRQHRRGADVLGRPARGGRGCRGADARGRASSRSGGYTLSGETASGLTLTANPRYWAGKPAVDDDRAGRRPRREAVRSMPSRRAISTTPRSSASMPPGSPTTRRSDRSSDWSTRCRSQYYGFDTTKPPFDDRARPAGLRQGRRLAADGRSEQRRRDGAGRQLDGAAGDPRAERRGLPAGLRPGRGPRSPGPGRLSRAAPGSRRPS